ncbi:Rne/Rng family ribonuclease, partial [Psychrobacter urativorans]|uniref:Rne/Rng family ribonuclease n=1 Tax=Psychrobacter urativorans TaxID=45610 RepID=UPI003BB6FEA4
MKRILINATQNEEIRVALCKGNHLYDFDLENRTREQKKSNIYKGHVTRVEPSLEAVFVEYGSQRQGFLPIREISSEYLSGNPRDENIKKLIKEGDELIVQVEKEERGNKGAALSTYVSLAGRYLVLMPNNPRGGGISRQISGKLREDMKRMLGSLDLEKGMSVIIRTAGIGKTQEDLQHDLNHLLNIWQAIQEQNQKYPSPRLVHQEAGVVTRAVRDYLRDDIAEIWIDNENAYIEAAGFIDAVMPKQAEKLRKYTDYEPMFSRFNIEKQIETAYQREVRLPSGGSIVIDQTEALVSIDINSAKSTKGSDVAETAYHTNLEAADEIARQLRLRDMGGLIVIDFIDMNDNKHQKEVEKRLIDATKYDRARVQFGDISKFGLMEMSRQRLRPSLEESTGYICPRCHGNGMIRDLRSLSLSIMRQIEQIALKERQGEVQAEVPTDIAAFLLNEKRDSLVYLEQDSGTRITILPHAHLESPNFKLHFNRDGFAPSSYERITDTQQQEHSDLGYNVDWQTAEKERPEQQPTRQPLRNSDSKNASPNSPATSPQQSGQNASTVSHSNEHRNNSKNNNTTVTMPTNAQQDSAVSTNVQVAAVAVAAQNPVSPAQPQAVAWLSNLFAQAPQAQTTSSVSSRDAAEAIETLVNTGAKSLGSFGQVDSSVLTPAQGSVATQPDASQNNNDEQPSDNTRKPSTRNNEGDTDESSDDKRRRKSRKSRSSKPRQRREQRDDNDTLDSTISDSDAANDSDNDSKSSNDQDQRNDSQRSENRRPNDRNRNNRQDSNRQDRSTDADTNSERKDSTTASDEQARAKRKPHSQRSSRGTLERNETLTTASTNNDGKQTANDNRNSQSAAARRNQNPNEVVLQVNEAPAKLKSPEVVHLSLDDSKSTRMNHKSAAPQNAEPAAKIVEVAKDNKTTSPSEAKPRNESDNAKSGNTQSSNDKGADTDSNIDNNINTNIVNSIDTDVDTDIVNSIDTDVDTDTAHQSAAIDQTQADSSEDQLAQDNVQQASSEPVAPPETTTTQPKHSSQPSDNIANTASTANTDSQALTEAVSTPVVSTETPQADTPVTQSVVTKSEASEATEAKAIEEPASKATDVAEKPAIELTHEALFAKRYVTANKFGKASNDPRIIQAQQLQGKNPAVAEQPVAPSADKPAIRGTVGDFIRATLADGQTRLADEGVINCFIAAIAEYKHQATAQVQSANVVTEDAHSAKADDSDSSFNFSNYGYQPLTADYVTSFKSMTAAASQFAMEQGKTSVQPKAVTARASNDPRGQHPSFQPQQAQPQDSAEAEQVENVDSSAVEAVDAHQVTATALTGAAQAEDVSTESEQLLQADANLKTASHESLDAELSDASANALPAEGSL